MAKNAGIPNEGDYELHGAPTPQIMIANLSNLSQYS
jgi:hypothetical protein